MSVSNLSSGNRPGVCTSTTRPTAPYEGQMIYETDTNRVLVWDNAAWVMIADTDQPPGLQLIKSGNDISATSASPLNLEGVFTSGFRNYELHLIVTQSVSNTGIWLQMLTGTNTLYNSSTYKYSYGGGYTTTAPAYQWTSYSNTSPFAPEQRWWTGMNPNSTYNASAIMTFFQPNINAHTKFFSRATTEWNNAYYSTNLLGSGSIDVANQFTGLRISTDAGTSSITYRLFGYRD